MHRQRINKQSSAGRFKRDTRRTKGLNYAAPMRGGIRL